VGDLDLICQTFDVVDHFSNNHPQAGNAASGGNTEG
jgi:hypothetical protein